MSRAAVALGSNLGDRLGSLSGAVSALALLPGTRVCAVSPVYETDPVGPPGQSDYLNAVVVLETELSPRALLGAALGIEAAEGRIRTVRNGPRTLDVDLLFYEGETSSDAELTLPHPRMLERAFVLAPLSDLFPDGQAPGLNFKEAARKVGRDGVRLYEKAIKGL